MNCDRVHELLSPHLDDTLVDPERAELLGHLADCPACREHFESLDQVVSLVRGIPPVGAPKGFQESVLSGLPSRSGRRSRLLRMIPTAAAACLLVCFGYLGARHFSPASSGPPLEVGVLDSPAERTVPEDAEGLGFGAPEMLGETASAKSSPVLDRSKPDDRPPDKDLPRSSELVAGKLPESGDASRVGLVSESRKERSLEYLVSGGKPDATAGLILAELQNRRARTTRDEFKEEGGPARENAVLERVESDDQGEPARLVLYLTAEEVQYILTLLAERNGGTLVTGLPAKAGESSGPGREIDGDGGSGPPRPSAPTAPSAGGAADAEEDEGEESPPPHRFRVDLRFDRAR
jgi:hypothetical protein